MKRFSLIPAVAAVATLALPVLTNSVAAQGTAYTRIDFPGAVFTLAAGLTRSRSYVRLASRMRARYLAIVPARSMQ